MAYRVKQEQRWDLFFVYSYSKKWLSPGRIPLKISHKSNKMKTFPRLCCCRCCSPPTDWPLTRFALSVYLSKLFPFSSPPHTFSSPSPLPVLAKTFEFCIRARTQLTQTHTNQWLFLYLMWSSSWWHIEGLQWIRTQSALWSDNGGSRGTVGGKRGSWGTDMFFSGWTGMVLATLRYSGTPRWLARRPGRLLHWQIIHIT